MPRRRSTCVSRVSARERYNIEAGYYLKITRDLEKAAQTYEEWAQAYPCDNVPSFQPGLHLQPSRPVGQGPGCGAAGL